jgi:hypothetical protein
MNRLEATPHKINSVFMATGVVIRSNSLLNAVIPGVEQAYHLPCWDEPAA